MTYFQTCDVSCLSDYRYRAMVNRGRPNPPDITKQFLNHRTTDYPREPSNPAVNHQILLWTRDLTIQHQYQWWRVTNWKLVTFSSFWYFPWSINPCCEPSNPTVNQGPYHSTSISMMAVSRIENWWHFPAFGVSHDPSTPVVNHQILLWTRDLSIQHQCPSEWKHFYDNIGIVCHDGCWTSDLIK
jgi:hypothetical protein